MKTCGVYAIRHSPSGAEYIGSSVWIERRLDHHLFCLGADRHTSRMLQKLWNRTSRDEWDLVVVCECPPEERIGREQYYIDASENLLNHLLVAGSLRDSTLSEETKQKIRESRRRYLETPGAREALAERARKQHTAKKLGFHTWKKGPNYESTASREGRARGTAIILANIRNAPPGEMRRRSLLRKNIKKPQEPVA